MRHKRANEAVIARTHFGDAAREASLRSNALWGRGGRRAGAVVSVVAVFAMASVAGAGLNGKSSAAGGGKYGDLKSYVPDSLLSSIAQNPKQSFDVILQGDRKQNAHGFIQKVLNDKSGSADENVGAATSSGSSARSAAAQFTLTGKQILRARQERHCDFDHAERDGQDVGGVQLPLSNSQLWPWATGAPVDWLKQSPDAATIAVVDSGIDATRTADFGARVLGQVNMTSLGAELAR